MVNEYDRHYIFALLFIRTFLAVLLSFSLLNTISDTHKSRSVSHIIHAFDTFLIGAVAFFSLSLLSLFHTCGFTPSQFSSRT